MKHNCENISIRKSEESIVNSIHSIIGAYYKSKGYDVYEKSYEFGIFFGCVNKGSWIHDIIFGTNSTDYGHAMVYTSNNYRICVQCHANESLELNKGLCQELNENMPSNVIWELDIIDNTGVI